MFTARSGAGKVNAERTFGAMNASGRIALSTIRPAIASAAQISV
jgi:hypothetical protein